MIDVIAVSHGKFLEHSIPVVLFLDALFGNRDTVGFTLGSRVKLTLGLYHGQQGRIEGQVCLPPLGDTLGCIAS